MVMEFYSLKQVVKWLAIKALMQSCYKAVMYPLRSDVGWIEGTYIVTLNFVYVNARSHFKIATVKTLVYVISSMFANRFK